MFNLLQIAKNNRDTFYDFDTGERKSIRIRIATIVAISLVLSSLGHIKFAEFLNSVLAVEAILVGFSFSVMFFLLSESGTFKIQPKSLEAELTSEKLSRLQREIFYNVSYFNMTAIAVVLFALLLLLPTFDFVPWQSVLPFLESFLPLDVSGLTRLAAWTLSAISWLLWFLFYFFLIESMYTFVRTVGRVNYYFNNKISRLDH